MSDTTTGVTTGRSSMIDVGLSYQISKTENGEVVRLKATTWDRDGIYITMGDEEILLSPAEAAMFGRWVTVTVAELSAIKAAYDASDVPQ